MAQENSQIVRDIENRIDERFTKWLDDSMSLFAMADVEQYYATRHMAFTMITAGASALLAAGSDRATAVHVMERAFDTIKEMAREHERERRAAAAAKGNG